MPISACADDQAAPLTAVPVATERPTPEPAAEVAVADGAEKAKMAVAGVRLTRRCSRHLILLSLFVGTTSGTVANDRHHDAESAPCRFTPAARADESAPGLILGAEVLLPEGSRSDQGVYIRFNGGLGTVGEFDAVRAALPDPAVLDCRGADRAIAA